ncbi:MAG TPA: pseudouridine-5'-phosphate glycosidase [Candidatus Xenobia bacterium]|jgi:pseudouridine-5'-phosphate glycosidase
MMAMQPEVQEALQAGRPVVALESTVWCHGLPQPSGLKAARQAQAIIRAAGATPAILAVRDGLYRVGLSDPELVAMCDSREVKKMSLRDLPVFAGLGLWGATTVSASLAICRQAGIDVFATGGIGGVHRGNAWDVSTDLLALGSHGVMVFCSGAKSLLDISATLERLETDGVAVVGYQTDRFPTFYTCRSEHPVSVTAAGEEDVARILRSARTLRWDRSIVVAQSVPAAFELPARELEPLLEEAHRQAAQAGVHGPAVTPWILAFLHRETGGRSLQANLALLEENARLAARVAVAAA